MESARECVRYPAVQWIVVDGASVEPGLREYVEGLDFVETKLFEPCTHPEAMNRIVELARGEYLMILPEDVQFVLRGSWLEDMVEIAGHARVGHVQFDAQRRQTLERYFGRWRPVVRGWRVPAPPMRRPLRPLRAAACGRPLLPDPRRVGASPLRPGAAGLRGLRRAARVRPPARHGREPAEDERGHGGRTVRAHPVSVSVVLPVRDGER